MLLERDRDRPVRQAVQEVGGAVERIDDPAIVRRAAGLDAALLHDEAVVGPAALQLLLDHLLGAAVGGRDEVARPLDRDLQLLDLAEIAGEQARGLGGGADHDLETGGAGHQGLPIGDERLCQLDVGRPGWPGSRRRAPPSRAPSRRSSGRRRRRAARTARSTTPPGRRLAPGGARSSEPNST